MDPITADQVRAAVAERRIKRWNLRPCSICDVPVGYVFAG